MIATINIDLKRVSSFIEKFKSTKLFIIENRDQPMNPKEILSLILILVAGSNLAWAGDLPDIKLTPGAIDSNISQDNIQRTLCVKGYTKTVRPPAYYTNALKKKQMAAYGYSDVDPRHYEEDHLIPLSIGGNPSDPLNLWPQPRISEWNAEKKDILEFKLYKLVCDGTVSLDEARREISSNWIETYKRFVK